MISRSAFVGLLSSALVTRSGFQKLDKLIHPGPRFAPADLRSDLRYLWNTLCDVGPDPFRTSDREAVEALFRDTSARLIQPTTGAEFTFAIAPLFAALNDGHVQIGSSGPSVPVMSFPLILSVFGDKLIVSGGTPSVPVASEILDIDGISGTLIRKTVLSVTGGQTTALRRSLASTNMYFVLAMLLGAGTYRSYQITWRSPNGEVVTKKLRSRKLAAGTENPYKPPSYTFRTVASGRLGVITYNRCDDATRMSRFLDDTFSSLRERPIRGLVIDMRHNLGGDSAVSDILLSRIAQKPFKQYGGNIVRSSTLLKVADGRSEYIAEYGSRAWSAPNGRIIVSKSSEHDLVRPDRSKPRFDGATFVIIGPGTFSSGMSCAAAAKTYKIATLVGEETGEPMNSTGEVFYAQAPHSQTFGLFPTKVLLGPGADSNTRGVMPDVHIPITLTDLATRRDPHIDWIVSQFK